MCQFHFDDLTCLQSLGIYNLLFLVVDIYIYIQERFWLEVDTYWIHITQAPFLVDCSDEYKRDQERYIHKGGGSAKAHIWVLSLNNALRAFVHPPKRPRVVSDTWGPVPKILVVVLYLYHNLFPLFVSLFCFIFLLPFSQPPPTPRKLHQKKKPTPRNQRPPPTTHQQASFLFRFLYNN